MTTNHPKTPLIILGITSLICSRTWFALLDDPEGPNLFIVIVFAAILFGIALATFKPLSVRWGSGKGVVSAIVVQIIVGAIAYAVLG